MIREVILLTCCCVCAAASADGPLRWKLQQGEQLTVTSTVESIQTTGAGEKRIEMPVTVVFTTRWNVAEVAAEAYRIEQQIERVQLQLKYPGFDLAFDSNEQKEGAAESLGKLLRPLVGATVTFQLTARGEVRQVKVPDALVAKLAANPLTKQMLSAASMKSIFSQASILLPTGNVQPGQTWTSKQGAVTGLGDLAGQTTYTYAGRQTAKTPGSGELSEIDLVHAIEATTIDSPLGGQLTISKATGSGKIRFDHQAGHLESISSKYFLSSKVELLGKAFEQTMQTVTTTQLSPRQVDTEADTK